MNVERIVLGEPQSKDTRLHLVNCKIEDPNGPSDFKANISKYFASQLEFEKNEGNPRDGSSKQHLKTSLRGRPLDGKCVRLPSDFQFARLERSFDDPNKLMATELTNEVTYWNLDKLPSNNDLIPQLNQWIRLSSDIHSHVQLEH